MGFQRSKRRAQNSKRPIQKIEEVLAFSKAGLARKPWANLPFQTCPHLSHATSALDEAQKSKRPIQKSKRQAQKSERHLAFPDVSAPVTHKLSFAEITGNLSKRRSQISKRRHFFQPRQHLSHAHSAWRKLRTICRRFLIKNKAREAILINHALVADTSERIVPLQVLKNFL
ncbi:hypothetical protein ACFX1R_003794 [Malus domestica]